MKDTVSIFYCYCRLGTVIFRAHSDSVTYNSPTLTSARKTHANIGPGLCDHTPEDDRLTQ